jgi:hypothetical protein
MDQREARDAAGQHCPSGDQCREDVTRTMMDQTGTFHPRSTRVMGTSASAGAGTAIATDTATATFTGTGTGTDTGFATTFRTLLARRPIDPAMEGVSLNTRLQVERGHRRRTRGRLARFQNQSQPGHRNGCWLRYCLRVRVTKLG